MNEKSCITINWGCCGSGNGGSVSGTGDGAPIGTVIAYMGTKAPERYLVCDGAELNIADYMALSSQIQEYPAQPTSPYSIASSMSRCVLNNTGGNIDAKRF